MFVYERDWNHHPFTFRISAELIKRKRKQSLLLKCLNSIVLNKKLGDMDDYELIDNEENHQYEFHIGKYIPRIEYIKTKNGEKPLSIAIDELNSGKIKIIAEDTEE